MITDAPLVILEHNWTETVRRIQAWRTDVLPARNGAEQRRRMRAGPLERVAYTITMLTQREAGEFARLIWSLPDMRIAFPRWEDTMLLSAPIAIGDTLLPLIGTIDNRRFIDDAILYIPGVGYERVEIDPLIVDPTSFTLVTGVVGNWPSGTRVIPIFAGNVVSPLPGDDSSNLIGNVTLEIAEEEDIAGVTTGGDPVTMVPASITARAHAEGSEGPIPYDDVQGMVVEVFDATGMLIPDATVTVVCEDTLIEPYYTGAGGVWNLRNIRTDGLNTLIPSVLDVTAGSITVNYVVYVK